MSDDLRVEAAADAITYHPGNRAGTPEQRHNVSLMLAKAALQAADIHDEDSGIHRVRVDDETVERVARVLYTQQRGQWVSGHGLHIGGVPWGTTKEKFLRETYRDQARDILAALTGAES